MPNLSSILSGRLGAIGSRVVVTGPARRRLKSAARPGDRELSAKLARASEQIRGARHGRRSG